MNKTDLAEQMLEDGLNTLYRVNLDFKKALDLFVEALTKYSIIKTPEEWVKEETKSNKLGKLKKEV